MIDLQTFTQFLPIRWQPYVPLCTLLAWAICAALMMVWKPPAPDSRWVKIYQLLNTIAMNKGWAASAYQPGVKAIMVHKDADRCIIKAKLGIPDDVRTKP